MSIFDLPKGEDDLSKKVREEWVKQIKRNRVVDKLKRAHYTFVKDILKKEKREFC